jgi:hypothetical protein
LDRDRHPNIVQFVGACWGRELTCLVLEWVPNGSLGDLLKADRAPAVVVTPAAAAAASFSPGAAAAAFFQRRLEWGDPLLKLAIDVARELPSSSTL